MWLRHAEMRKLSLGEWSVFCVALSIRVRVRRVGLWGDGGDRFLNADGWHGCVLAKNGNIGRGSPNIINNAEGSRNAIRRDVLSNRISDRVQIR